MESAEIFRITCAIAIATLLSARGRKRKSLSPSGSIAAFFVGFLSWASSVRFGATLIAFYLASTRATRFRAHLKAKIEDDFSSPSGNRNALQVLASSAPAVVSAVVYSYLYRYDAALSRADWLKASLQVFYLLFFAACAGDTFASELGIALPALSTRPFLIIAPWRKVPTGTNGGITWQGTAASALGGGVVGFTFYVFGPDKAPPQLIAVPLGVAGGVLGSAIDSVLGAILQISLFDKTTGKILKTPPAGWRENDRFERICGTNILSGEAVNLLAAIATGLTAAVCAKGLPP